MKKCARINPYEKTFNPFQKTPSTPPFQTLHGTAHWYVHVIMILKIIFLQKSIVKFSIEKYSFELK